MASGIVISIASCYGSQTHVRDGTNARFLRIPSELSNGEASNWFLVSRATVCNLQLKLKPSTRALGVLTAKPP